MKTQIKIAFKLFIIMTLLTGVAYPLCVTGISQVIFPLKANGSQLKNGDTVIGSLLIGQSFNNDRYFQSRPSTVDYQTLPSGASNLSVTSKKLEAQFIERKRLFLKQNNLKDSAEVPSEMLFASASGLDPHISVKAAELQVQRIAQNRSLNASQTEQLQNLIDKVKESRQLGLFGEPKINVLALNFEMDQLFKSKGQ
jgi:potassium-transporting ATPase KdpC subunit